MNIQIYLCRKTFPGLSRKPKSITVLLLIVLQIPIPIPRAGRSLNFHNYYHSYRCFNRQFVFYRFIIVVVNNLLRFIFVTHTLLYCQKIINIFVLCKICYQF